MSFFNYNKFFMSPYFVRYKIKIFLGEPQVWTQYSTQNCYTRSHRLGRQHVYYAAFFRCCL